MTTFYRDHYKKGQPKFDPFGRVLPITYNITTQQRMLDNKKFKELYDKYAIPNSPSPHHKQIWICKPGENANRGKGIVVLPSLDQVCNFL